MNCKPGDLAVVVKSEAIPKFLGLVVKVTTLCPEWRNDPHWCTEKTHYWRGWEVAFADDGLRPIRPGDITDSEVRELYAPQLPEVA